MQIFLIIWFLLTGLSVAFVAYDLMTNTPEMKVMKWGWVMVTLYTGIFGLIIYIFSCREPALRLIHMKNSLHPFGNKLSVHLSIAWPEMQLELYSQLL